jgi:Zinc finger, C2H2 type
MGKVYICATCDKEYTTSSNLCRHIRRAHVAVAKTRDRSRSPMRLSNDSSSASVSSYDEGSDRDADSQDTSNQSSDANDALDVGEIDADDYGLKQDSIQHLRHILNMAELGVLKLTMNGLLDMIDGLEPAEEDNSETDNETEDTEAEYDASDTSESSEPSSEQDSNEKGADDFGLPQEAITMLHAIFLAAAGDNFELSKNMLRTVVFGIYK